MDAMAVPPNPRLDLQTVTMAAWVRPVRYDIRGGADRGIIMNKEGCARQTLVFVVCCPPCRFVPSLSVCLVAANAVAVACQSQSGLDSSAARMICS